MNIESESTQQILQFVEVLTANKIQHKVAKTNMKVWNRCKLEHFMDNSVEYERQW